MQGRERYNLTATSGQLIDGSDGELELLMGVSEFCGIGPFIQETRVGQFVYGGIRIKLPPTEKAPRGVPSDREEIRFGEGYFPGSMDLQQLDIRLLNNIVDLDRRKLASQVTSQCGFVGLHFFGEPAPLIGGVQHRLLLGRGVTGAQRS